MDIVSDKIPMAFTNLPLLLKNETMLQNVMTDVVFELSSMEGKPASSNATFKEVAEAFTKVRYRKIYFAFYWARNPFVGHNVISYADHGNTIYYNTRFHSKEKNTFAAWIENFFHELTHLADQNSPLSFSHKNQKDTMAAPFIVGALAREVFEAKYGHKVFR